MENTDMYDLVNYVVATDGTYSYLCYLPGGTLINITLSELQNNIRKGLTLVEGNSKNHVKELMKKMKDNKYNEQPDNWEFFSDA